MSTLATNIRRLMAQQDLTYTEVVEASGLDARTLRGLVRGTNTPHARTLHKLAAGLGVAVDELFQPIGSWYDLTGQVDATQANATHRNVRHAEADPFDTCHAGAGLSLADRGLAGQGLAGKGLADLGLADLGLAGHGTRGHDADGHDRLGPEEEFDRDTNPAIPATVSAHPEVFAGWTAQQFAELSSRFGVGGALNEEGALAAARAMNAKQDVVDRVAVILETSQARLLSDLVDLLYDHLTSAHQDQAHQDQAHQDQVPGNPSPAAERPR